MNRKMVILTEGYTNPHHAKTARNLIHYKPEEVLAVFDRENAGRKAVELLGFGDNVPVIEDLSEAPEADTLLIGVATPGGIIPASYKPLILKAVSRKMNIISGLHEYLSDDLEIAQAARLNEVKLTDIRKNDFKQVVNRKGINNGKLRILTVGNDCSLGKMVVSLEVSNELKRMGYDSKFVPTGQTGILIEGDGIPVDNISGDYLNGAAEQLVLRNQNHDIMMIEGQGSIIHPRYSSVSLGLLHGSMPHGMLMCYEMGREVIHGVESMRIPPLAEVIRLHKIMADVMFPSGVFAIAINSRKFTKAEADAERERIKEEFGLPACDVMRHGPAELAEAVVKFREKIYRTAEKEAVES